MNPYARIDLTALREKLKGAVVPRQWRSIEEAAETPEFRELVAHEYPDGGHESADRVGRRDFIKLMTAALAMAGLNGCTRQPIHDIVPYVEQPENLVPGIPLLFSTAMPHNGFALGIQVKSYEGHPVKIDGNPGHPMSLGGSNLFIQAALLDLYDPDRSQAISENGEASGWNQFIGDFTQAIAEQRPKHGAGLRILTETVTSPTLSGQLQKLLQAFPEARWHQWQPVGLDEVHEGARLAFGEIVETHYAIDKAEVIVAFDSDFLQAHPASLRYARQFSNGRRIWKEPGRMNRLYSAESTPTVTGSVADHRVAVRPGLVSVLARELARRLGVEGTGQSPTRLSPECARWIEAAASDLQNHRGNSAVVVGEWQPAIVHALGHAINGRLDNFGKTVRFTQAVEAHPVNQMESLRRLVEEMKSGKVETLLILGGNPVFNAPVDLDFAGALKKVRRAVCLGLGRNETSALCRWHVPETHFLEAWSDARAFDGTVTILQPLIAPLFNGVSAHELVEAVTAPPPLSSYEIVRRYWRQHNRWDDFESSWRQAVHDGWVGGTQLPVREVRLKGGEFPPAREARPEALEISFRPDPSIWDGRYANNGWMQETPRPITKITWENAALISPRLAEAKKLANGDLVFLSFQGRQLSIPVWITPGQADGCVTLHMGNGRRVGGTSAVGSGFDVYGLRSAGALWSAEGLELRKGMGRHEFAVMQLYQKMPVEERQIVRVGSFQEFKNKPNFIQPTIEEPDRAETLYNVGEHDYGGYRWAMAIDLTACIGCNACVVGCEAENNIPVVGRDQVRRGRIMHWIRVDTYFEGELDNPKMRHVPMPCMHCESAPCELVCPVEATLHDHEGLNVQVYNRCVGTRFCSNNCPYKVRRFNFYQYQDYETPIYKPMRNPQVTVRWRGVMEKCTYCVQRISAARISSEKEKRQIADGEVQPACAQACPTEAIVFGNLSDPKSRVSQLRRHPLMFSMLGEQNTRPRTTYLTKLDNP